MDGHPIGGNVNTTPGTHIYGVNWYSGHLDFYYDGTRVASASNASLSGGATISSSPMYLILLYDAGGSVPAPATMVVHYVRVFQSTPSLSALPTNGAVSLSWNPLGFILQTNGHLTNPAGWKDVPEATNSPTTMTVGSNSLFFRLRHE